MTTTRNSRNKAITIIRRRQAGVSQHLVARLLLLMLVAASLLLCLVSTAFRTPSVQVMFDRRMSSQQEKNSNSNPLLSFTFTRRRMAISASTMDKQEPTTSSNSAAAAARDRDGHKIGDWEELHGNYLLRPPLDEAGPPRALLHFLGGALVGHAPHISYRYVLERLAAEGYLVVATPYNLSFDHLSTCDDVIAKFENIAKSLARTYGALPVIGVGHSCGSLLQLLITSLFPDTPRAANALISFNNKPVQDAVPFFDEFFAPFFTYVSARNDTTRNSGSEIIRVSLDLAKAAANGEIPSDTLLTKASKLALPPGLSSNNNLFPSELVVPGAIRNAFSTVTGPTTTALESAGAVTMATEVLDALQQIPLLIDEVADGARDFVPPPYQVKAAARRSYRARRTLLLQYDDDPLDETDDIEELLLAAGQVIRMKRPMIEIDVQHRVLPGGHAAPLLAPPLELAGRAETLLGADAARDRLLYAQADRTVDELVRWLEESNL